MAPLPLLRGPLAWHLTSLPSFYGGWVRYEALTIIGMRRSLLASLLFAACTQSPVSIEAPCPVTPTVTRVINNHSLVGKADRDVFVYIGSDRILRTPANGGPEKLLVFLAKAPTPLPSSIAVVGQNLRTGTQRAFDAQRHESEFGTEWGTNFSFPDAGCWQLSVSEGGNQGRITIEVK
jgi:hypothetical protein